MYEKILKECQELGYRDKLKLATTLLQQGRKEEEKSHAELGNSSASLSFEDIVTRVMKSKPKKLASLERFINAMFNFNGSISEKEIAKIIARMERKYITIVKDKVLYRI